MASNSFGSLFKILTWGESHGKAIGVVIDGCPAGIAISAADIQSALALRAPGRNSWVTPRQETDEAEILSGVFEGETTGAPISILIPNRQADSTVYDAMKHLVRPGHANQTYQQKYGVFDHRGGGRASARETAGRVAAAAIARVWLKTQGIEVCAYLHALGDIVANVPEISITQLQSSVQESPIFCPDETATMSMLRHIETMQAQGNSTGGIVQFMAQGLPVGLGDPVYEKLDATLAKAMLSIPASKGFEIGEGFAAASMLGSEHNDVPLNRSNYASNHAGGVLGGISTGMPLWGRVAFKPTSSIRQPQSTIDMSGNATTIAMSAQSKHDPCVAVRAVPVVEAMLCLVMIDALLMNRCARV